jgi:hypothetical protein
MVSCHNAFGFGLAIDFLRSLRAGDVRLPKTLTRERIRRCQKMHFTEIVVSKEGYSRLEACLFFAR